MSYPKHVYNHNPCTYQNEKIKDSPGLVKGSYISPQNQLLLTVQAERNTGI